MTKLGNITKKISRLTNSRKIFDIQNILSASPDFGPGFLSAVSVKNSNEYFSVSFPGSASTKFFHFNVMSSFPVSFGESSNVELKIKSFVTTLSGNPNISVDIFQKGTLIKSISNQYIQMFVSSQSVGLTPSDTMSFNFSYNDLIDKSGNDLSFKIYLNDGELGSGNFMIYNVYLSIPFDYTYKEYTTNSWITIFDNQLKNKFLKTINSSQRFIPMITSSFRTFENSKSFLTREDEVFAGDKIIDHLKNLGYNKHQYIFNQNNKELSIGLAKISLASELVSALNVAASSSSIEYVTGAISTFYSHSSKRGLWRVLIDCSNTNPQSIPTIGIFAKDNPNVYVVIQKILGPDINNRKYLLRYKANGTNWGQIGSTTNLTGKKYIYGNSLYVSENPRSWHGVSEHEIEVNDRYVLLKSNESIDAVLALPIEYQNYEWFLSVFDSGPNSTLLHSSISIFSTNYSNFSISKIEFLEKTSDESQLIISSSSQPIFNVRTTSKRLIPVSVVSTYNWTILDSEVVRLQNDPSINDSLYLDRSATVNTSGWSVFNFNDPPSNPSGTQKFRIKALCTESGGVIKVFLYEGGVNKQYLGNINLTSSFSTYSLSWDPSILSNVSGNNVEIRLDVKDNLSSGFYRIDAIDWVCEYIEEETAPPPVVNSAKTERLVPNSVVFTSAWSITTSDISALQNPPDVTDGLYMVRSGTTSNRPEAILGFKDPSGPLSGTQKFRVKVRSSNVNASARFALYEANSFISNLGSISCSTPSTFIEKEFIWEASALSNITGTEVQIYIKLDDTLTSGTYEFDYIDWVANVVESIPRNEETYTLTKVDSACGDAENVSVVNITGATLPTGKIIFLVGNRYTGASTRYVSSITHPNLSSVTSIGSAAVNVDNSTNNRLVSEAYIGTVTSGGTGTLTVNFTGTTYFIGIVTLAITSATVVNSIEVGTSGGTYTVSANISGATHGIAAATGGLTVSNKTISLTPWAGVSHVNNMRSSWDEMVVKGDLVNNSNKVITVTPVDSSFNWSATKVVLIKAGVSDEPPPPPPPPPPPGTSSVFPYWPPVPSDLGFFLGVCGSHFDDWGSLTAYQRYVNWLGRVPDMIGSFSASDRYYTKLLTWDDVAGGPGPDTDVISGQYSSSINNCLKCFDTSLWPVTKPILLTCALVPDNSVDANYFSGSWRSPSIYSLIKNGTYDVYYQRVFTRLAKRCLFSGRNPWTLVMRLGHEMNGNWFPWSVGSDVASFKEAWRRIHRIMKDSVESVFGSGYRFLVEFGPSHQLRFGSWSSERLWNLYPGDDVVDIITISLHDPVGIVSQSDWDKFLHKSPSNPDNEGWQDFLDWAVARGKKIGISEMCGYNSDDPPHWKKTQNPTVFFNSFHRLISRYRGAFVYFLYMIYRHSFLWDPSGWGQTYKDLYGRR